MSVETTLVVALLLPALGSIFVGLSGWHPNVRETVTLATAGITLWLVASLWPVVAAGGRPRIELVETLPGVPLVLELEPLGMLFALVASFLWVVTSVYAIGYMRGHHELNQTRFYVCFAVSISGALGVAMAGNLFTLFVFYEVLTLATYPLVTHSGTEEARRAGRIYLGILLSTSIGLQLAAIVWTWAIAGGLDFTPGGLLAGKVDGPTAGILLCLYVFGVGKAAIMPLHRWLPAAMVAPTPVSALLHAVAVVKAGVFTVLKVAVYVFGLDLLSELEAGRWLAYLAGFTIIAASLIAMRKDNLKARLAYSTVSQLSYILLGALLATSASVAGAGMHIVMHAFGKITLFFCAGAIMVATHKTEVSQLAGLGRRMPITMAAFLVGSLSIIGLPPFGGMWSKWFLAAGTLQAGEQVLLGVLMLSSLLNVAYLLPIPAKAFFGKPTDRSDAGGFQEAPMACVAALVLTALGCALLFIEPDPFHQLATQAIAPLATSH
ncbi:MAG: monovalent cation/H+ antiporter subunit D family protein [Ectothiorhodospiraceae bacterium]|nr:monovalent cation/H+ antiporter subunit D family protein [Chromatiales bacterium]MCP5157204.1 monovalent cation/H+ antiporter subunit D family protein [Ectothiorhodospiraceae bacterium]